MITTDSAERPRILFISDNRDNLNWGSQSTSMALLEMLSSSGLPPTGYVNDEDVRRTAPIATLGVLDRRLSRGPLASAALLILGRGHRSRYLMRRVFGVTDGVSEDPVATVSQWKERQRAPFDRWRRLVEEADAVIINGEGSMIFTLEARREQRFHLAIMQQALSSGVPYMYVNAMVSDPPSGGRNEAMRQESIRILASARCVTARDPQSYRYFTEMSPDIPATYLPDAVFTWHDRLGAPNVKAYLASSEFMKPFDPDPARLGEWRFDVPYLCVGGSSEAAKDAPRARASYALLIGRLAKLGLPLYVTASSSGDVFLEQIARELGLPLIPVHTNVWAAAAILANAAVVVTGRYHPAILAGLGGVPAVMLGADSHKTASVQDMLGYPETRVFPVFPDEDSVELIASQVESVLAERTAWQAAIRSAVADKATLAAELGSTLRAALGIGSN